MLRSHFIICQIVIFFSLSSCSINKITVNSSAGLLYDASNEIETEGNYETFKSGVAGNLLLIEGLLSQSPDNLNILATLNKGYAGYAFAVNETEMRREEWGDLKTELGKSQALLNYTRSLNFGFRYLKLNKIEFKELIAGINDVQVINQILEKNLSYNKKNLELVLFTAQSLAALINLQKDNMSMVAQLPLARAMFDWVCTKDPKINYGMCDIFYGAYEAGRPKMLGGNPQLGKEIFQKAIEQNPNNWLIRTSYMQYYLIPQNDKVGFDQQVEFFNKKQPEFTGFHIYSADSTNLESDKANILGETHLRFYQSISLKQFELMNKYQKQLF